MNCPVRICTAVFIFALFAGPLGANEFQQVWRCEFKPGKSLDDARAASRAWITAARGMRGGERLRVHLAYPIVVADSAERFDFVITAPSLQAWGGFYDGYDPDSAVGRADAEFAAVAACSGSTLWETVPVE